MDIVMNEKLKQEMKNAENAFLYNRGEDSKIPNLDIRNEYIELSFYRNGICYYLSNKNGNIGYTWQLSKKEFIQAKKTALELLKNCSDEYKRICLDVIDKLDYEEGHNNARFSINPNIHEKERILIIRFNYKNLIYDWNLENNTLTRANIDDPFANLNEKEIKGLEKKLVLRTMRHSRALDKKIGEFYNK